MPRTLDSALLAAMNAGNFTPYFKVELLDTDRSTVLHTTTDVVSFELDGLNARVEFYDPNYWSTYYTFRISRGITVSGVPNIITSSQFYPRYDRREKRIRILEGHVFPNSYYSTPGDVTYSSLINTVCTHFGFSVTHANPATAWLSYQFYPAGRTLVLNDAREFFTILRQKYLIFGTDLCGDTIYFYQAQSTVPTYPTDYYEVQAGLVLFPGQGSYKEKTFLSRDEFMTVHISGGTNKPMHNLGYLELAASQPTRYWYIDTIDWPIQNIAPNLKYLDFDNIYADYDSKTQTMWPTRFKEIFNKKKNPSWQWEARYLDIFGTTEGGTLPSTLEASAPYTPLHTGYFTKTLSSSDNNVQAAMETLDNHDHSGAASLDADDLPLTTGNFTQVLSGADDNVQHAMDTIDDHTHGIIPIADGGTGATTASGARTNLGLGTIAIQDADAVLIEGGYIAANMRLMDASGITIATGAITITQSYHQVDTEGGAASDDLDNIYLGGSGGVGSILILRSTANARNVVLKDGTGNLKLAGDCTLDTTTDTIMLIRAGTNWLEVSRSINS